MKYKNDLKSGDIRSYDLSPKYNSEVYVLLALFLAASLSAISQNEKKWSYNKYGSDAVSYAQSPVVSGYLVLNTRNLKGLINRSRMDETSLDTLVNSDTLFCRIKLHVLRSMVDIELPGKNVVSIPYSYIESIEGRYNGRNIPLTKWMILSPDTKRSFGEIGRQIASNENVIIYDSSKKDTLRSEYECPIFILNGHDKIRVYYTFTSAVKSLKKFIQKRYNYIMPISGDELSDQRKLINYIIQQENNRKN